MFYTIYQTTNKVNGKIYIGAHKTDDLNDGYLGSGKHLKRAMEKYGIDCFEKEILFLFETEELMYQKESELVNKDFIKRNDVYNMKEGGFGGWDHVDNTGKKFSESSRKKMSIAKKQSQKGENNSFYGKRHDEEAKKKIGESSKKRAKGVYEKRIEEGNHPNNTTTCPHCEKIGQYRAMKRWHFNNCKLKC